MSSSLETFEIAAAPLAQVKRLEAVCRALARRTDNLIPRTLPQDLVDLSRLGEMFHRLPESTPGDDITLSIFNGLHPRQSYIRLQLGPRVIELGELQVCTTPEGKDDWFRLQVFGAWLGVGAGCNTDGLVSQLGQWIDAIERQCDDPTSFWHVETGDRSLGHEFFPAHLDE